MLDPDKLNCIYRITSYNVCYTKLLRAAALAPQAKKNATIILSMIPVLMIYPFAQKYFASGVMIGAEKG